MIFFKKKDNEIPMDVSAKDKLKESIFSFLEKTPDWVSYCYNRKQYDEMIRNCDKVLENEANDVQILLSKGLLLEGKMKTKDAQQCFEEALELEPENLIALGRMVSLLEIKNDKKATEFVDRIVPLVRSKVNDMQNNLLKNYFDNDEQIKEIYTKPILLEKHSTGAKVLHATAVGIEHQRGANKRIANFLTEDKASEDARISQQTNEKIRQMNEGHKNALRTIRGSILVWTDKKLLFLGYDGLPIQEIIIDKKYVEKEINDVLNKKQEFEAALKEKTQSDSVLGKVKGSFSRASARASFTTNKDIEVIVKVEKKKHLLGKEYLEIKTNRPIPDIERGSFGRMGSKTNYINELDFAEKSFESLFEFLEPRAEDISSYLDTL